MDDTLAARSDRRGDEPVDHGQLLVQKPPSISAPMTMMAMTLVSCFVRFGRRYGTLLVRVDGLGMAVSSEAGCVFEQYFRGVRHKESCAGMRSPLARFGFGGSTASRRADTAARTVGGVPWCSKATLAAARRTAWHDT